jgi:hypothetical protein
LQHNVFRRCLTSCQQRGRLRLGTVGFRERTRSSGQRHRCLHRCMGESTRSTEDRGYERESTYSAKQIDWNLRTSPEHSHGDKTHHAIERHGGLRVMIYNAEYESSSRRVRWTYPDHRCQREDDPFRHSRQCHALCLSSGLAQHIECLACPQRRTVNHPSSFESRCDQP